MGSRRSREFRRCNNGRVSVPFDKSMKSDRNITTNLRIDMAMPAQEPLIRALLAQHQLPSDDIAHHLRHFHVANLDGCIVGAAGLEIYRPFALVRSLVVSQDLWGQGIARQLYNRSESYARQQGVVRLYLLTLTAPGFFGKYGFVEIDRNSVPDTIQKTREFAEVCPASATCMVKYLNGRHVFSKLSFKRHITSGKQLVAIATIPEYTIQLQLQPILT